MAQYPYGVKTSSEKSVQNEIPVCRANQNHSTAKMHPVSDDDDDLVRELKEFVSGSGSMPMPPALRRGNVARIACLALQEDYGVLT
ncbi:MAG: hypothetical protein ACYCOU_06510 [Sulfobacillus sp.]